MSRAEVWHKASNLAVILYPEMDSSVCGQARCERPWLLCDESIQRLALRTGLLLMRRKHRIYLCNLTGGFKLCAEANSAYQSGWSVNLT